MPTAAARRQDFVRVKLIGDCANRGDAVPANVLYNGVATASLLPTQQPSHDAD
jgi:hypothetical protein